MLPLSLGFLVVDALSQYNFVIKLLPNTLVRFSLLFSLAIFGAWFVGYLDYKTKMFEAENTYTTYQNEWTKKILRDLEEIKKKLKAK